MSLLEKGDRYRLHLIGGTIDLKVDELVETAAGDPLAIRTLAAADERVILIPWTSVQFLEELPQEVKP